MANIAKTKETMKKNYIALESFSGAKSLAKGQIVQMAETDAKALADSGLLGEYYESDVIPTFDLNAMGAVVGQSKSVDATELYNALERGIVKCKLNFMGNQFDWNVLGIKILESGNTFMEFSGTFLFNGQPAFVQVTVHVDSIKIDLKVLSGTDFSV